MLRHLLLISWVVGEATALHAGLTWEQESQELPPVPAALRQMEARFKFKNTGVREIKITGVKTSCGCVLSALTKDIYAPGEAGEVMATFVFGERIGQQEKTIVVQTDDPEQPMKILTMRVVIPQPIEVNPALVLWRIGEKPEEKRMEVKLQAGLESGELTATSSNPAIEVRLEKGRKEGQYSLVVAPKETAQPQSAFIRVETGGSDPKSVVAHVRVK